MWPTSVMRRQRCTSRPLPSLQGQWWVLWDRLHAQTDSYLRCWLCWLKSAQRLPAAHQPAPCAHLKRCFSCCRLLGCSLMSPRRSKAAVGVGACSSRTRRGTEAASAKVMRSVTSELRDGGRVGSSGGQGTCRRSVDVHAPCTDAATPQHSSRTVQQHKNSPQLHPPTQKPAALTRGGPTAAGCKRTPGRALGGRAWSSTRCAAAPLPRAPQ